jgi:3-oxoacid CoA-transferase subunit A
MKTDKNDILVILGDVGINYIGKDTHKYPRNLSDEGLKKIINELPVTLFCIHGNHEIRPESLTTYEERIWNNGTVYIEPEFPDILFARDGEIYKLNGKRCIVIGGAYSVDKEYRLLKDMGWWADEQPSAEVKKQVEERLAAEKFKIDIVFSHTCPYKYVHQIFPFVYKDVDNSTEKWLDTIENQLDYSRWYCGHMHKTQVIGKMQFMYEDFAEL